MRRLRDKAMNMKCCILLTIFFSPFSSCFLQEYTPEKSITQKNYELYLSQNKSKLDFIADSLYIKQINYINGDSLLLMFKNKSFEHIINEINYASFVQLENYRAIDFKLKIKENKCVDFFLTKIYINNSISDSLSQKKSWSIKGIDKSPCL